MHIHMYACSIALYVTQYSIYHIVQQIAQFMIKHNISSDRIISWNIAWYSITVYIYKKRRYAYVVVLTYTFSFTRSGEMRFMVWNWLPRLCERPTIATAPVHGAVPPLKAADYGLQRRQTKLLRHSADAFQCHLVFERLTRNKACLLYLRSWQSDNFWPQQC